MKTLVPISCGGVTIGSGDIVAGDANGVLAVPQDKAAQVLEARKNGERSSAGRKRVG